MQQNTNFTFPIQIKCLRKSRLVHKLYIYKAIRYNSQTIVLKSIALTLECNKRSYKCFDSEFEYSSIHNSGTN